MIETRSVSLGLELDLNQDILKGSHARFCPGLDSSCLDLKKQVCLVPGSFSYWGLPTFLIDVFVMGLKCCVASMVFKGRENFLDPRIDKIDVVVYPKGFSTELNIFGDKQPFDDILEKKKKKEMCKSPFLKRGRCEYHKGKGMGGDCNSCTGPFLFSLPTSRTRWRRNHKMCLRSVDNDEDIMRKCPDI